MSEIAIAIVGRARGNRGEVTAVSLSSDPGRFARLSEVWLSGKPVRVEEVWWHGEVLIFKFAGVDSISEAEKLAGAEVQVPVSERIVLEPGNYFHSDLIGCAVRDRASGNVVGAVAAVPEGLLELGDGTLIPFARGICVGIDIVAREITVDLPEGLLELNKQ